MHPVTYLAESEFFKWLLCFQKSMHEVSCTDVQYLEAVQRPNVRTAVKTVIILATCFILSLDLMTWFSLNALCKALDGIQLFVIFCEAFSLGCWNVLNRTSSDRKFGFRQATHWMLRRFQKNMNLNGDRKTVPDTTPLATALSAPDGSSFWHKIMPDRHCRRTVMKSHEQKEQSPVQNGSTFRSWSQVCKISIAFQCLRLGRAAVEKERMAKTWSCVRPSDQPLQFGETCWVYGAHRVSLGCAKEGATRHCSLGARTVGPRMWKQVQLSRPQRQIEDNDCMMEETVVQDRSSHKMSYEIWWVSFGF
jgi:hypothetical protein